MVQQVASGALPEAPNQPTGASAPQGHRVKSPPKKHLLVVGSVAYDNVTVRGRTHTDLLGGAATHASIAASPFVQSRVIGVVGHDFKDEDHAAFTAHGVDTEGLVRDPSDHTFRWGGVYERDLNHRSTLYTHLGVFKNFIPEVPDKWKSTEVVFLANIHPELQLRVLDSIDRPKFAAMDTMDLWIETERASLLEVFKRVNAVIISDEEGRQLTGEHNILKVGWAIQKLGPSTVVLKRGEHGAVLFHRLQTFTVPAILLEDVVDPTGAGDSFAGGFVGWLAYSTDFTFDNLRRAMTVGTVVASFCVEGLGLNATRRMTLDAIAGRHNQLVKSTTCPHIVI